jgi:hypothetical protein
MPTRQAGVRFRLLAGSLAATSALLLGVPGGVTPAVAGTRAAPVTTDTGQVYDLVIEFMFNNGDALQFPNDGNQVQNDLFEQAPINKLYYTKQKDTTFWERFGITDTRIALERDTTAPPNSPNNSYDAYPWGSMWMPRYWTVGQETTFSTTIRYFNKYTCAYSGGTLDWRDGRHFLRWQGPIDMGGSLGVTDVVIIDRYHWLSDDPGNAAYWNPKEAERFWFARGRGWVRWDYFADRTTGPWNSSDPTVMKANATQTVKFINNYPAGNSLQPNKLCNWLTP